MKCRITATMAALAVAGALVVATSPAQARAYKPAGVTHDGAAVSAAAVTPAAALHRKRVSCLVLAFEPDVHPNVRVTTAVTYTKTRTHGHWKISFKTYSLSTSPRHLVRKAVWETASHPKKQSKTYHWARWSRKDVKHISAHKTSQYQVGHGRLNFAVRVSDPSQDAYRTRRCTAHLDF
jgi:hypothetical protein